MIPFGALAQSNLVLLVSQPGDYIGGGQNYVSTNPADLSVGFGNGGISASAFGFDIWVDGPNEDPLTVGTYTNAARDPFNGSNPGLSVFGNGNGCNNVCGSFRILELGTDTNGNLTSFWMTFTQYCECDSSSLTGELRYNSTLAPPAPAPVTLAVPAQYSTIQSALDAASLITSDTVLVSPGTYTESLNFDGRSTRLISLEGPAATIIVPPNGENGITLSSGETTNATIMGFTILNGGSGVYLSDSAPNLISNVITGCQYGLYLESSSPLLSNNVISGNSVQAGYFGGGSPVLQGNIIQSNGYGFSLNGSSAVFVDNLIQGNNGDGIAAVNESDADIIQNIISDNAGNGITFSVPGGGRGPLVVNNTFVNNNVGINVSGFDSASEIINNVVVGTPALDIEYYGVSNVPVIQNNDFFSPAGNAFTGVATNLGGTNGNISADPMFACSPSEDFRLTGYSSCIDAGSNGAPFLPATDYDGNPRIVAGVTNGPTNVDMGAYEFQPLHPPTECLFVTCPTDMVVVLSAGQSSAPVTFAAPEATPGATVTFTPPSGTSFSIGANQVNCTGTFGTNVFGCSFQVDVVNLPAVAIQPQYTNVLAGWPVTLSAEAEGGGPFTYQWLVNGNQIPGANDSTLFLPDPQNADSGDYNVAVSNPAGSVNSSLAILRVLPSAPVIVTNPVSMTVPTGDNAAFSVTVYGTEPMGFQWYCNQKRVKGATSAQLAVTATMETNAGEYQVIVTNALGRVASSVARLSLTQGAPVFVVQPASVTVPYGSNAILSAQAAGSAPIHYQWYFQDFENHPLQGQTNSNLVLHHVTESAVGTYFVNARNNRGVVASQTAEVTVAAPPKAVGHFAGQIAQPGENLLLAPNITGAAPMSYSWQFNGSFLPEAGPTLLLTNVTVAQSGYYQVTVNNDFGSLTEAALLSVLPPPSPLVAWGDNSEGQSTVPPHLNNVVAAAGGDFHSIALRSDGTLTAWGNNADKQLDIPKKLPPILLVAAGAAHNLAVDNNGLLHAWGDDTFGQCDVPAGAVIQPIAVAAGNGHSLALLVSGAVVAWGDDTYGQVSLPPIINPDFYPGPAPVQAIAAGLYHSLALLTTGAVVGWGDDSSGQIDIPENITNAVAITAGDLHSAALLSDGTVAVWGDNTYGQTNVPPGLTNVVAIAAGNFHTLALLADGSVVGWGGNQNGQANIPATVRDAVGIAAGEFHSMALLAQ